MPQNAAVSREAGATLTLGFGTSVSMWMTGYLARLPGVEAPSWLVLVAMLALSGGGGFLAGRWSAAGWRTGLSAGLLSAALNLLVQGSLLSHAEQPNRLIPSAAIWLPGALLLGALIGAGGAWVGSLKPRSGPLPGPWKARLGWVAAAATLGLIALGGLVTSHGAGLAVVDWPNSFGYTMFLYPLSRMTGGIYYEHAHRLFGTLVGLTTLAQAWFLWRCESRPLVRRLGLASVALVIVQGLMGGLRVTGRFTLSDSPADTAPNLALAVVHGVTGQIFLALMIGLAVMAAPAYETGPPARPEARAKTDRSLTLALVGILIVQLVLGAVLRHTRTGLLVHISMAALVLGVVMAAGVRAWGIHGSSEPILRRLGLLLLGLGGLQLVLGIAALAAVVTLDEGKEISPAVALVRTAHQVNGALLLGSAVALALWVRRRLAIENPPAQPESPTKTVPASTLTG